MKFLFSALMIAVLSLAPGLVQAADNIVGTILEVEGSARVTDSNGQAYDAAVNGAVHPQDVLSTGPGSRLYIQFIDNTEFTLSENAQFTVEEYNFDPKDKNKNYATYSVLQGAFLYVSGLVAKKDNPDVHVNIPQGSIGIRGTKFWGGEVNGEYGVIVGEGKVVVKNKAGAATLTRGQGTTLKDRVTQPTTPKKWSSEKIAKATATVALKDPANVGARMVEARAKHDILVEQHKAVQATTRRIDPALLERRVEEKIIRLHPEMRPDLLTDEQRARMKAGLDARADTDTATDAPAPLAPSVDATAETKTESTLRDRLEAERLNSVDQKTLLNRLNNTDTTLQKTTTETIRPQDGTTIKTLEPLPGTQTSTTTVRETTDTVTDTGNRALTTTTETTTTVRDVATDTVKATTGTVQQVTETPIVKEVTTTEEKALEPISRPVGGTTEPVKPATEALKELREKRPQTRPE